MYDKYSNTTYTFIMQYDYRFNSIIQRRFLSNFQGEWLSDLEHQNFLDNSDKIDEFYHTTPVNYQYNSLGYRTKEFSEYDSDFILAMGCSHTEGTGLPENKIWCNVLGEILDTEIMNLGAAGQGLQFIAYNTDLYLRHHLPLPKMVVIQHPERTRKVNCRYEIHTSSETDTEVSVMLEVQHQINREHERSTFLEEKNLTFVLDSGMLTNIITRMWNSVGVPVLHWTFNTDGEDWLSDYYVYEMPHDVNREIYDYEFDLARDLTHHGYRNHQCVANILADQVRLLKVNGKLNIPEKLFRQRHYEEGTFEYDVTNIMTALKRQENLMTEEHKDKSTHEGSMGTDRHPPSGTEQEEREAELKRRIEELRKRDPFIYR